MRISIFIILFCSCFSAMGSIPDGQDVLKEGKLLYRLEKASWYTTDDFLAKYPDKLALAGGYVSYEAEDGFINTVFFERENPERILIRYHYTADPDKRIFLADTLNVEASQMEKDLIALRINTIEQLNNNSDEFFSYYSNASFNIIPLITPTERKVYILTGPKSSGVVLIGNDYLLKFSSDNEFVSKEKIHNTLVVLDAVSSDNNSIKVSMHSHVKSEIIDATDICTLLLYRDFVEWKKHYVISSKYISMFDLETEELVIMTMEDWEKNNIEKSEL